MIERIIDECRRRAWCLVSAESCTGGMIAAAITDIAGASDIFGRGFITYSNQAKIDLLGVPPVILDHYGAVSSQTARSMAEGALARAHANLSIAVTGIAGPGGATRGKPVGLVYIGSACREKMTLIEEHRFTGNRAVIRQAATQAAFRLLARQLDIALDGLAS